jgi:hypothetical protein
MYLTAFRRGCVAAEEKTNPFASEAQIAFGSDCVFILVVVVIFDVFDFCKTNPIRPEAGSKK